MLLVAQMCGANVLRSIQVMFRSSDQLWVLILSKSWFVAELYQAQAFPVWWFILVIVDSHFIWIIPDQKVFFLFDPFLLQSVEISVHDIIDELTRVVCCGFFPYPECLRTLTEEGETEGGLGSRRHHFNYPFPCCHWFSTCVVPSLSVQKSH